MVDRKFKSLHASLLKKIITIFLFVVLSQAVFFGIDTLKENQRRYASLSSEFLSEVLYSIANVNSVLMQQMRCYTKFDDALVAESDPNVIQARLKIQKSKKYKEFESISYLDYKTGIEYFEDGTARDGTSYSYYKALVNQRQKKKALQMYSDLVDTNLYCVCKEPDVFDKDGYTKGCYIGRVRVDKYLQRFVDKMRGTSWSSPIGITIVMNTQGTLVCQPERGQFFENIFEGGAMDPEIAEYIKHPYELNEKTGKKTSITGKLRYKNIDYFITIGLFSKTSFTLAVLTPAKTITAQAWHAVIKTFIVAFSLLSIALLIVSVIFRYEFKPLKSLAEQMKDLTEGSYDLSKRINSKDYRKTDIGEIQLAMNEFMATAQYVLSDISKSHKDILCFADRFAVDITSLEDSIKELSSCTPGDCDVEKRKRDVSEIELILKSIKQDIKATYDPLERVSQYTSRYKGILT